MDLISQVTKSDTCWIEILQKEENETPQGALIEVHQGIVAPPYDKTEILFSGQEHSRSIKNFAFKLLES